MAGIVPSGAFNEQLKRTVREQVRRERPNTGRAGRWHKKGGGTGGNDWVIFQPVSVYTGEVEVPPGIGFTCDALLATILVVGCGSGWSIGDEIIVWDLMQGFLSMPPELVENVAGVAHRFDVHESDYDRPPGLEGNCRWVVTQMPCVENTKLL